MQDQAAAPRTDTPPAPAKTRRGLLLLGMLVGLLLLALAMLAGSARWLLVSDEGTLWLL